MGKGVTVVAVMTTLVSGLLGCGSGAGLAGTSTDRERTGAGA